MPLPVALHAKPRLGAQPKAAGGRRPLADEEGEEEEEEGLYDED